MANLIAGKVLKWHKFVGTAEIEWKQDSILGVGGNRSQIYDMHEYYVCSCQCCIVTVFIQYDWTYGWQDVLYCDEKCQYGITRDGEVFLVLHDKEQTPYVSRFILTERSLRGRATDYIKDKTGIEIDLKWMKGQCLEDVVV